MGEQFRSDIPTAGEVPTRAEGEFRVITDIPGLTADWITELHCLPLGTRARNLLLRRTRITTIRELLQMSDREILSLRGGGRGTLEKIRTILKERETPGQVVIIDISSEIMAAVQAGKTYDQIEKEFGLRPKITQQIVKNKMPEEIRTQRRQEIIAYAKTLFRERPGKGWGVLAGTARQFGLSRERVRQIMGESLRRGNTL